MWTWCSRPLCSCRCRRVLASDELTFRGVVGWGKMMGTEQSVYNRIYTRRVQCAHSFVCVRAWARRVGTSRRNVHTRLYYTHPYASFLHLASNFGSPHSAHIYTHAPCAQHARQHNMHGFAPLYTLRARTRTYLHRIHRSTCTTHTTGTLRHHLNYIHGSA
jgi:hypothetical protein